MHWPRVGWHLDETDLSIPSGSLIRSMWSIVPACQIALAQGADTFVLVRIIERDAGVIVGLSRTLCGHRGRSRGVAELAERIPGMGRSIVDRDQVVTRRWLRGLGTRRDVNLVSRRCGT